MNNSTLNQKKPSTFNCARFPAMMRCLHLSLFLFYTFIISLFCEIFKV